MLKVSKRTPLFLEVFSWDPKNILKKTQEVFGRLLALVEVDSTIPKTVNVYAELQAQTPTMYPKIMRKPTIPAARRLHQKMLDQNVGWRKKTYLKLADSKTV